MEIKTLIISNNLEHLVYIFNTINKIDNLKIICIATNNVEILSALKKTQFNLILFDYSLLDLTENTILNEIYDNTSNIVVIFEKSISDKKNITSSIFLESVDINSTFLYSNLNNIVTKISKSFETDRVKQYIINELLSIGFDFKYKGTKYLLETILYIYKNKRLELLENLEENVYKYVANINNKSILNVKTNIIRSTSNMYSYQDKKLIEKYFSINYKPTPKTIITTIIMKLMYSD